MPENQSSPRHFGSWLTSRSRTSFRSRRPDASEDAQAESQFSRDEVPPDGYCATLQDIVRQERHILRSICVGVGWKVLVMEYVMAQKRFLAGDKKASLPGYLRFTLLMLCGSIVHGLFLRLESHRTDLEWNRRSVPAN